MLAPHSGAGKMYDLFTPDELLQKFIAAGEVGRGRNKTSLKTAKQVYNVVYTELKKTGRAPQKKKARAK